MGVAVIFTLDNALHAGVGAIAAFALAYVPVLPGWAVVGLVLALGVGREGWQAWSGERLPANRWPWNWTAHRWAEALAWLPGAVIGVGIHAAV